MTRDELVECTALLAAVREGRLDLLHPPVAPLDVLAQQLVAEVAGGRGVEVEALSSWCAAAAPYADLTREDVRRGGGAGRAGASRPGGADGAPTSTTTPSTGGCGPGAGARLAALTSGGAIPETGDYRVVLDPEA